MCYLVLSYNMTGAMYYYQRRSVTFDFLVRHPWRCGFLHEFEKAYGVIDMLCLDHGVDARSPVWETGYWISMVDV